MAIAGIDVNGDARTKAKSLSFEAASTPTPQPSDRQNKASLRWSTSPRERRYASAALGIEVRALLRRTTFAATVSPVIEDEDICLQPSVKPNKLVQPVTDVAGVAMKPDQGYLTLPWNEPPMQPDPVGSPEKDLLKVQTPITRVLDELPVGEEYEIPVDQVGVPSYHANGHYDGEPQERTSKECRGSSAGGMAYSHPLTFAGWLGDSHVDRTKTGSMPPLF